MRKLLLSLGACALLLPGCSPASLSTRDEDPYVTSLRKVLDESRALVVAIDHQKSPDTLLRTAQRVNDACSYVPEKIPDSIWRKYRMSPIYVSTADRSAQSVETFVVLYWRPSADESAHQRGRKALAELLPELRESNAKLEKLLGD